MKQFLSADQLDEIEEIIEMKITHRKNIDRRRERFGYESVSQMVYYIYYIFDNL